jgi:uncharacterized protein (DUF1015 family)
MIVKPFRGFRPAPALADRIPSVPYDVVTTDEARDLARGNPYSFLHVIRPEIDLEPGLDPHDDRVYERGRETFDAFVKRGWLVRDAERAYYIYRLRAGDHSQSGIVGAAAVQDYLDGRIKKHEHTRPEKEQDRVRLIETMSALPGPIFLTYRPDADLAFAIAAASAGRPAVRFTGDGVEHALWVVADAGARDRIERHFRAIPATYVADGHHRTAAAARVCSRRIAALEREGGSEPCRFFLAVHFPSDELRVLDYNRVVRDLAGMTAAEFVGRLRAAGLEVTESHTAKRPESRGSFGMYLDRAWYLLTPRDRSGAGDVVAALDVSILTRLILGPLLGIHDPRTDSRIDFVGGSRGTEELERRVDSGGFAVAFALYPTSLDDVMRVADAGEVMPPKSTWFEPKLRSGVVVQSLMGTEL